MTVAYFDCFGGISGDMTLGALIDAGGDRDILGAAIHALRLDDEVSIEVRHEERGHAGGTRVIITTLDHTERSFPALRSAIVDADIPEAVSGPALKALRLLAQAESIVHNLPEERIHLHELGGADTLVDLVGAFWLLYDLKVTQAYASPLPVPRTMTPGSMPLPAPASLRVLQGTGAILEPSDQRVELVTPTGAAILAIAAKFDRPTMSLSSIGYGIGARDIPGNALAVWIGEDLPGESGVTLIETNLDDMAPNLIAALAEDLMAAGALDVTVVPALMKKGRPGHLLSVMTTSDLAPKLTNHLLRHSTTLGVRVTRTQRVLATRKIIELSTPLGTVRFKVKELGGQMVDAAAEYEDCRQIARQGGHDLRDVIRAVTDSARTELGL